MIVGTIYIFWNAYIVSISNTMISWADNVGFPTWERKRKYLCILALVTQIYTWRLVRVLYD